MYLTGSRRGMSRLPPQIRALVPAAGVGLHRLPPPSFRSWRGTRR